MKIPVIITDRAANAIKRIVQKTKETSLVGGEDVKGTILQRLRRLGINAEEGSRKAKFDRLDGEYRSVVVWDYRIYYKISADKVIVLDVIVDLKD